MSTASNASGSEKPDIAVTHNRAEHRFVAVVDGHLAVCDYARDGARMVFTHTFVPPELRGRGIAERLVRPALEFARDERLQVVPACSYVAVFVERHREFQPLLAASGRAAEDEERA